MGKEEVLVVMDPGHGQTKVKVRGTKKVFSSFFRKSDQGRLDLLKLSTGRRGPNGSFRINVAGSGYYDVNLTAAEGFDLRQMGVKRYRSKEWANVLLTAALHQMGATVTRGYEPGEVIPIRLGVCAPMAYLVGIGNERIDVEAEICRRFKGRYEIRRGKQVYTAHVKGVAVWGEGFAGYLYYTLADDLKSFKTKWAGRGILVLDIGWGTINALVVKDGQATRSSVSAEMWGVDLLYNRIATVLDNSRGTISPEMVEQAIRSDQGAMVGQPKFKQVAKDAVFDYVNRLLTLADMMIARSPYSVEDVFLFGGGSVLLCEAGFGRNALDMRLKQKGFRVLLGDEFTNLKGLNKLIGGKDDWEEVDN